MENKQAVQVLETALNQATKNGSFTLVEVSQILQALQLLKEAHK